MGGSGSGGSSSTGKGIAAAGGVVWRSGARGHLEIAVVHRPRYGDWSLPKGKLERGETELMAAVREVHEEIGATVAVQRALGRVGYHVGDAAKTVAYWTMRLVGLAFEPNEEVDELRWLGAQDAMALLSYELDREVVHDFAATPAPDCVIVLVRHAKAGKRTRWSGDDDRRPLDRDGERQAEALVPFLSAFGADRLLTAEPDRCRQTLRPFASATGLSVHVDPVFGDEAFLRAPQRTRAALLGLTKPGTVTVVCSQGSAIPGLLEELLPALRSTATRKAESWVLSFVDGDLVGADHYPAPV